MKTLDKLRPAVAALLCLCWLGSAVAEQKHMLWQADSGDRSVYLLGSLHVGTDALYPMADAIMQAFAAADVLVVEINILEVDPLAVGRMVAAKGMYPSLDNNLRAHISDATWQLLNDATPALGLPIEYLQQQKPWLVSLNLTTLAAKRAGYDESFGIDLHFLRQAQGRKSIVELESMESQLAIFNELTASEQEEMLEVTLKDLDSGPEYFRTLFDAWSRGDAAAIDRQVNESLKLASGSQRLSKLLLLDRNVAMLEKIEQLLDQGKQPFVVVGSGHVVGEDGLVEMLRRKGYQVRQL